MTKRRVHQETKSALRRALVAFVVFCIALAIAVILLLLAGTGWE